MAHWAKLDENNVVIEVTVGDNFDPNGDEGYQWLVDNLGGKWVKTSYNATIRKNFAAVGFIYDEILDAFIAPKPFDSWVLDNETCTWVSPSPYPESNDIYVWDESTLSWKLNILKIEEI